VVTEVSGASATKIINDIIDGKTNIDELMKHLHKSIKTDRQTIRKALVGRVTDHHRFMLSIVRESIQEQEKIISKLDAQIDKASREYSVEVDLLQSIPGIGKDSAITIISEIGIDMSRFPNEHHLSSWAGLCPGSNERAGKNKVPEPPMATNSSRQS